MSNRNEFTGDLLQSKVGDPKAFSEGFDRIFNKDKLPKPKCNHWVLGWEREPEKEEPDCCGGCK